MRATILIALTLLRSGCVGPLVRVPQAQYAVPPAPAGDPLRGSLASRLSRAGIRWNRCGENIYRESGMEEPADDAVEGWMRSPAHRASILDPLFTQGGVGIAINADTEYFITQIFIRPK